MWRRPQMDMQVDPEEIAALSKQIEEPYNPEHFLTPLERGMMDLYKDRPIRMKRFLHDFRWIKAEMHKRGVEL